MSIRESFSPPAKTCASCGRRMEYRKRWRRSWDEVRYCSDACRRRRRTSRDAALEARLIELLSTRGATDTVCPSEVARSLEARGWRPLMESVRRAARRLAAEGRVEFLQNGRPVDPSTARGPVRLGRGRRWGADEPAT